jgi:hypothetical protein
MSFISPPVPEWPPGGSYGLPPSHSSSWTCAGPLRVPDDGSVSGNALRRGAGRDTQYLLDDQNLRNGIPNKSGHNVRAVLRSR